MTQLGIDAVTLLTAARPPLSSPVESVAQAIQLSVAPVFLLTGIAALLGMLTNRLARIIDRTRLIQEALKRSDIREARHLRQILEVQRRRTYLVNRAIFCATATALLVSVVVAVLFIGTMAVLNLAAIVAPLFVLAMLLLSLGLILFLAEVQLAIRQKPRRYF